MHDFIKQYIEMPDTLIGLLIRFLNQNKGKFSKRAHEKEFKQLTQDEVDSVCEICIPARVFAKQPVSQIL